jgi:hypothetical protein
MAELARYVARLRAAEAAFAAALRRMLEPLPIGRAPAELTPELRRRLANLRCGGDGALLLVDADPPAAADRIAELEAALVLAEVHPGTCALQLTGERRRLVLDEARQRRAGGEAQPRERGVQPIALAIAQLARRHAEAIGQHRPVRIAELLAQPRLR